MLAAPTGILISALDTLPVLWVGECRWYGLLPMLCWCGTRRGPCLPRVSLAGCSQASLLASDTQDRARCRHMNTYVHAPSRKGDVSASFLGLSRAELGFVWGPRLPGQEPGRPPLETRQAPPPSCQYPETTQKDQCWNPRGRERMGLRSEQGRSQCGALPWGQTCSAKLALGREKALSMVGTL